MVFIPVGENSADGQFRGASGIAIDRWGDIYIADRDNHRIQKFNNDGEFLGKWGEEGTMNGLFKHPVNIAVSDDGELVYVVENTGNRVQIFRVTRQD